MVLEDFKNCTVKLCRPVEPNTSIEIREAKTVLIAICLMLSSWNLTMNVKNIHEHNEQLVYVQRELTNRPTTDAHFCYMYLHAANSTVCVYTSCSHSRVWHLCRGLVIVDVHVNCHCHTDKNIVIAEKWPCRRKMCALKRCWIELWRTSHIHR